ncbi:hypothetical protein WJX81_006391 [Elliptochloris bilobata]|uniref:J domain-containing protein n=1 Tax=Elliptochloris bilobata TaxID=381761 RepID=A0AAW1QYY3_9CHLO
MAESSPFEHLDPYVVLGVERTATAADIKSAYRRKALRVHPDKHQGDSQAAEAAAEEFRQLSFANTILSDPDKRRRYDAGGLGNLKQSELENVELDVSSLGPLSTAMAALFAKMGVPIKTSVPLPVLEAARSGAFRAELLPFGAAVAGRVEKSACHFYTVEVLQEQLDGGFFIAAHSTAGSKFKLLLFEQGAEGQWEVLMQEDSMKALRNTQLAGLFFLGFDTYNVGPKVSPLELQDRPEAALFKRLANMAPRELPVEPLRPGRYVVAVYGDNWFKKAAYTLEFLPASGPAAPAAARVREAEAALFAKRGGLQGFEADFQQAQAAFLAAAERYGREEAEVDALLGERDAAYLQLLAVPSAAGRGGEQAPAAQPAKRPFSLFGR